MTHQPLAFQRHDHGRCQSRIEGAVERACAVRGLRLTPIRRRVLEILLEEHKALGAYDVLARLADDGRPAHPPVAYRALDFLVAEGFAHKIERLNAFVACLHPEDESPGADRTPHRPAFLICRNCRTVAEADIPRDGALGAAADALGFRVEAWVIEAEGLCPACAQAAAQTGAMS